MTNQLRAYDVDAQPLFVGQCVRVLVPAFGPDRHQMMLNHEHTRVAGQQRRILALHPGGGDDLPTYIQLFGLKSRFWLYGRFTRLVKGTGLQGLVQRYRFESQLDESMTEIMANG